MNRKEERCREVYSNSKTGKIDIEHRNPLDVNLNQFKELKFGLSQHIRKSGAIPWEKTDIK